MATLIEALQAGNYRKDACLAAGIHYNTLRTWEQKGENQISSEYMDFLESLRRAEAEAVVSYVEIIAKAAQNGDWRAAAWWLAHKYPNNWAKLEKRVTEDIAPDTNNDVVQRRLAEYLEELERLRIRINKS